MLRLLKNFASACIPVLLVGLPAIMIFAPVVFMFWSMSDSERQAAAARQAEADRGYKVTLYIPDNPPKVFDDVHQLWRTREELIFHDKDGVKHRFGGTYIVETKKN